VLPATDRFILTVIRTGRSVSLKVDDLCKRLAWLYYRVWECSYMTCVNKGIYVKQDESSFQQNGAELCLIFMLLLSLVQCRTVYFCIRIVVVQTSIQQRDIKRYVLELQCQRTELAAFTYVSLPGSLCEWNIDLLAFHSTQCVTMIAMVATTKLKKYSK